MIGLHQKRWMKALGLMIPLLIVLAFRVVSSFPLLLGAQTTDDGSVHFRLDEAPYAPMFDVLDTESSLGPYDSGVKRIRMEDLIKMHGHPCDGLVTAACGLSLGLEKLFPDGVIDRTDTACITNNSPCFGDVAAYLTGGRIRVGSQKIDPKMGIEFILYRMSTGRAVRVAIKPGVFPADVSALEKKIKSGDFTEQEMRLCQKRQWEYARDLVNRPLKESFEIEEMEGFSWQADQYEHLGVRGDVVNKDFFRKQ